MPLCVLAAGATDLGRRRERNEDRFAIVPHQRLYLVADGMGGHRCGATASRLATETIVEFFRRSAAAEFAWPLRPDPRLSLLENRLLAAIRAANHSVYERGVQSSDCRGLGSTVVTAVFDPEAQQILVGHVGDSRAYRARGGELARLTRDHSVTGELLPADGGAWFERFTSNALTRALGLEANVIVDLRREPVNEGDVFVLCSDGLTSLVPEREILEVVSATQDLPRACAQLIECANRAGGDDNITVVVLRIERAVH
jgi:protein phosphatase